MREPRPHGRRRGTIIIGTLVTAAIIGGIALIGTADAHRDGTYAIAGTILLAAAAYLIRPMLYED